jgi:hypothetical protein
VATKKNAVQTDRVNVVVADRVSEPPPDELDDIVGTIANDDTVLFALPRVIEGSRRRHFRISRA